jgi:hypothetical protein
MVNLNIVVSFHKMALKCCLEDDEIERQLKLKIFDVGLCIFGCFKNYHTRARFSFMMWGGGGAEYSVMCCLKAGILDLITTGISGTTRL